MTDEDDELTPEARAEVEAEEEMLRQQEFLYNFFTEFDLLVSTYPGDPDKLKRALEDYVTNMP